MSPSSKLMFLSVSDNRVESSPSDIPLHTPRVSPQHFSPQGPQPLLNLSSRSKRDLERDLERGDLRFPLSDSTPFSVSQGSFFVLTFVMFRKRFLLLKRPRPTLSHPHNHNGSTCLVIMFLTFPCLVQYPFRRFMFNTPLSSLFITKFSI